MEKSFDKNMNIEEEILSNEYKFNFGSLLEILLRRKKIFILFSVGFFLIATTNLIYRRIKSPVYRGSFTIMISDPFINDRSNNNSIEDLALNREAVDIPTLVQYLKSPGVVSSIAKKNGISAMNLINRINISIPRNDGRLLSSYLSKTLLISVDGENKFKMQKILDDLSKQYVIKASESRNKKLSEGINFLNSQKPKILLRVQEAQNELEKFRLNNKIINPINEGTKLTSLIEKNENQILSLKSENIRLLFIKENLINGILYTEGIGGGNSSTNNSAGLGIMGSNQLLLQEILNVKSQLANAQSKYKKSSIVIKNLEEKLKQLEPILLKNQKSAVEAAIIVNDSLIKSYENQLSELKKRFISIPGKVTKYSEIMQDLEALEENLQSLNSTKDKLELDLSQGTLPWSILKEPLVNPNPIKPEIRKNLIYIILSTLALGSLITYLVEKLDDVFHNPKEVEKFINLPTLGFVPFFNFNSEKLESDNENDENIPISISNFLSECNTNLQKNTKFIFEETFRNIYTAIKFSNSDKKIKIINITSTVPEEGKSLCSLFLAVNTSQISKKVLIIDTDLRRPTLHKRLEVDNVVGISNYLVNEDTDWKKYINKHKTIENLSFVTSGKIPPNSISLLESNKMKTFIEQLKTSEEYDFVILDCPPVLGLSDALIISNYVDATILTVSLNKVNKKLTNECFKKLKSIDKPVIGTIINSVSKEINNNFLGNKYYSYGNFYNNYSYKYMPKEIQTRYFEENDNESSNTIIEKIKLKNKTFLEKSKLILNSFVKWINE